MKFEALLVCSKYLDRMRKRLGNCVHIRKLQLSTSNFALSLTPTICYHSQGKRGQWTLKKTGTQSFLIKSSFIDLWIWVVLLILIGWFNLAVAEISSIILIYRSNNLDYHNLGCLSIYRPLSYPWRTLIILDFTL